jgi:hypothetical protein
LWSATIVAIFSAGAPHAAGEELASTTGLPNEIDRSPEAWDLLCDEAVGDEPERAVAILRAAGVRGWQEFRRRHRSTIEGLADRPACLCDPDSPERRVAAALDKISAQRDAASSGMYWHTDLSAAIAEAKQGPKPILSLRLLGRLDDDLSCANSRFFRTTLYADAELARHLREHFVLHWESVRPVPVITIDFGDGRTMRRTITGNSAHYVLDPQGRVVDCLPGLYSPAEFRRRLDDADGLARVSFPPGDEAYRRDRLVRYHEAAIRRIDEAVRAASMPIYTPPAISWPPSPVNVAIIEASPLEPAPSLSTALGNMLLASRPNPEPFAPVTLPTTVLSGSLLQNSAGVIPAGYVVATAGNPVPNLPDPAAPFPSAREASRPALTKGFVETKMIEAVLPTAPSISLPIAAVVVAAPGWPFRFVASAPNPSAAVRTVDGEEIVRKALAAAMPSLENSDWPFTAGGAISVYREPGRPMTKGRVEEPLEEVLLNTAAMPSLENPAWPADAPKYVISVYREPAITKIQVEKPLTNVFRGEVARTEPAVAPRATDDVLGRLAEQMRGDVRLATGSLKLIRAKFDSMPAQPVEGSPTWRYQQFDRMLEALRTSIAGDTARNEFDLHRRIHAWLAENPSIGLSELNERVYAELFLTPRNDPWLGLAPADAFPALDHGGLFPAP